MNKNRVKLLLVLSLALTLILAACAGPSGSQGTQGPAGSVGPAGSAGPAGPAGPRGVAGSPGSTGPAGKDGASATVGQIDKAVEEALAGPMPSPKDLAHAGRLYDKWWGELKSTAPAGDNPLWALQSLNTRSGSTTYRCKECHGWDYKGIGGWYSTGSHKTGFTGITGASSLSRDALVDVMSGGTDYRHDFRSAFPGEHMGHMVDFLKWGLINDTKIIDYSTKKAIGANTANGKTLYDATCSACHGSNGRTLLFDGKDGIGDIASGNPVETVHKIRFGQPGTPGMPSAIETGWSMQNVVDVLGYSQTLEKK